MRICVVTSLAAAAEPRAPRHAIAAREAFPAAEIMLVDMAPTGAVPADPQVLAATPGIERRTLTYPTRRTGLPALVWRKLQVALARLRFRLTGRVSEPVFGASVVGLAGALKRIGADVLIAHNIETLAPASDATRRSGARLVFDCMEYYADMGDSQTAVEAAAARRLQAERLPECSLVTASSEALGQALAREYAIPTPLALYNTPARVKALPERSSEGLRLYWRNAVIGLSQRGLDEALVALTLLPAEVVLAVQGRPPTDGGMALRNRIAELGLEERVRILPPYAPGEAVREAAAHSVGLCLERRGPANHELTVSNKLFDYMMAGLAVVVSDLPSLRAVAERSGAGLWFEPGSAQDLAAQIARLRDDPGLLARLAANARRFALEEGNVEVDMARFKAALSRVVEGGDV